MPAIPAEVLPRMQAWWAGLDGGTQAMFEAIYMDAPEAVSRVVSGGAWEADGSDPGLAAQLGTDGGAGMAALDSIPVAVIQELPTITPFHATVGQAVDITWTEVNRSTAQLPDYATDIYVSDANQATIASARLDNAALAAGASGQRAWQFAGAPAAGRYSVAIYVNSEGSDPGSGVPGPQGYRSYTSAQFEVGGGDEAANQQDEQAWSAGAMALMQAGTATDLDERIDKLREGVNWLAAHQGLTPEESAQLGKISDGIDQTANRLRMDPEIEVELLPPDKMMVLNGTAQANMYPSLTNRAALLTFLTSLLVR